MKKLSADWYSDLWEDVGRRDANSHVPLWRVFFDKATGDLLWIPGEEDLAQESKERLAKIEQEPERYEEIQPLTQGQHHEIFREFFDGLPAEATKLCNPASIGRFLKDCEYHVGPADYAWRKFYGNALREKATDWLRDRGWDVEWRF